MGHATSDYETSYIDDFPKKGIDILEKNENYAERITGKYIKKKLILITEDIK